MNFENHIVIVDENDNEISTQEKLKAHQQGNLHRAFSVFLFNQKGEMLLQQRALSKYHSAGLWSNACCSHPRPGEDTIDAAHRRLVEEMGFDCQIEKVFDFIYRTEFDDGLIEHEFDHVFIGKYDGVVKPDPDEVESYKWVAIEELKKDIRENPQKYTSWFKIAFDKVMKFRNEKMKNSRK